VWRGWYWIAAPYRRPATPKGTQCLEIKYPCHCECNEAIQSNHELFLIIPGLPRSSVFAALRRDSLAMTTGMNAGAQTKNPAGAGQELFCLGGTLLILVIFDFAHHLDIQIIRARIDRIAIGRNFIARCQFAALGGGVFAGRPRNRAIRYGKAQIFVQLAFGVANIAARHRVQDNADIVLQTLQTGGCTGFQQTVFGTA